MIVDFHTHWYPETFFKRIASLGRADLANSRTQSEDLSDRIAEMDRLGVDRQVLSFVGLNAELTEEAAALEAAQLLNDTYREARDRYPGRFDQFGKVPLPFIDAAVAETVRCLDVLGAIGMALACSFSGHVLDDPTFDPFWKELDRRSAIAFIHPVGRDSCCHWGMEDYGLDAMFGSPMQIGLAATRLVFSGVSRRFPNVKFLFAQGGGNLPSRWHAMERILELGLSGHVPAFLGWTQTLDLDAADLMGDFRRFYYDSAMMDSNPLLHLCNGTFGADRMVLGSDTAFGSLTRIMGHIRETHEFSADEKATILETNTAKLLAR